MKTCVRAETRGFTLIELLCIVAIIGLLAALLLPALNRGNLQARRIRCVSNLRNTGLSFLEFAHAHEDKFPIQVSTNQGGSSEFLDAARAVNGEFYFSYRQFLPLANELRDPKLLVCPADTRVAATNFESLRNENLSYFAGANPQFGRSDSILSGDRNIAPVFGSRAQVGGLRYLRWTHEMHQNKGNVLFADGHVEQLKDVLALSNNVAAAPAELLLPTVKAPPPPVLATKGGDSRDGSRALPGPDNRRLASVPLGSNAVFRSGIVTNLVINSGPPGNPPGGLLPLAPQPPGEPPRPPTVQTSATVVLARTNASPPAEVVVQPAPGEPAQNGATVVPASPRPARGIPWWLLVIALLAVLEFLRRRLRGPARVDTQPRDELLPH